MKKLKNIIIVLLCFCTVVAEAQNLNNPNKMGPLGTQVNTITGNMFLERNDLMISSRGFDIDVSFSYNSYDYDRNYNYGNGWGFNYDIFYKTDTANSKIIKWGNGREDEYKLQSGGSYKSPVGFFSKFEQYQPNKYVLTELSGTKFFFDNPAHKKITRVQNPNGNFLDFSYTDTLLTTVTTAAGQAITFSYNAKGQLATVTDAVTSPTRTTTFAYDAQNNLLSATDPLGQKTKFTYLPNGPMKTVADKNNNLVNIIFYSDYSTKEIIGCNKRLSFSYDTLTKTNIAIDHIEGGQDQVTNYKYKKVNGVSWLNDVSGNCCGYNVKYEFDDEGNQIKMTDANGNVYTYTYDANGNMLTATDPLGQASTYTYTNDFNKVATYTDEKGLLTTMAYDAKGNLTQIVSPGNQIYSATYGGNGDILTSTNPKGNVYNYNFDSYGNPISVTGPENFTATLSFDARGNLLAFTDGRNNASTLEYDILDRLKKITDPINNSMQYTYDANGNATTIKNKNNENYNLSYDASDRVVQLKDPIGNYTSMSYDAQDNIKIVTNAIGNQAKLSYDKRNRLTAIVDPEGNSTSFSYDAHGNIISATMKNGNTVNYTYDKLHRLKSASDQTGSLGSLQYDANGNITSVTNPTGAVTAIEYDNENRIKKITDPLSNSTSFTYDLNNNIASVTDRNGHTSTYTYDDMDRPKTVTDNNGFVTSVTYDVVGNVTALIDQNNHTTTYTYDSLNRRKVMTLPDGKFTQHFYDKKGNVVSIRRTDASIVNYVYDSINRITSRIMPDGEVYAFTYDRLGRVITASNNSGVVQFTHDNLNRVTSETFDGRTTTYQYNIAGRTQTTTYPDGSVVKKDFDARNRLTGISKNATSLATYTYNNANQLLTKNFGNGVVSTMQYDFANRLSTISTGNGSIQNTSFTYDNERNKTAIVRNNNLALSEQFTYDNGYRLTNYKRGIPGGTATTNNSYSYDAVGNRTATVLNGATSNYIVNNLNQITSISGAENKNFVYDSRGNMTFDGSFYKFYDAENRLIKDSSAPASVIRYNYDAFNRKVIKWVNNDPKKYSYSGAAQIEERDGSNNLLNSTVFTSFLTPISNDKNGSRYYYHANEMMSVEAITQQNGGVAEKYSYDAYGKQTRTDASGNALASSVAGNRFGYTGQEYDSATANNHFFFRNYSPATGAFAQRDLIEYGDGTSMYQYVGNNPANGVDVWGLQTITSDAQLVTQLLMDETGNAGFLLSLIDFKRAMAEARYLKEYSCAAEKFAELGEKAFKGKSLSSAAELFAKAGSKFSGITKIIVVLGKIGTPLGFLDLGLKANTYNNLLYDPNATELDIIDAEFDIIGSGGNLVAGIGLLGISGTVGVPVAVGLGIVAFGDFITTAVTGRSFRQHLEKPVENFYNATINRNAEYKIWLETFGLEGSDFLKNIFDNGKGDLYLKTIRKQANKGQCAIEGGTRRPAPVFEFINKYLQTIRFSSDPNEVRGSLGVKDGDPDKKWVSVKDRLPYTILFENAKEATAPAKFVRITTPVEPKQDVSTMQLGSFGFNSTTFTIPANAPFYYNRVDVRDSLGLYVDLTAGYDQLNNLLFWEFQTIDPITLLPPEGPFKGFLLQQDSTRESYGHGFVNFTIKPKQTAITLDTIAVKAEIIFDDNEVIPTNTHTNTIDAFAPTSQLAAIVTGPGNDSLHLSWTGADDTNGVGIDYYTLYITKDQVNYSVFATKLKRTDTSFVIPRDSSYCFFVLATDRVGNLETLRQSEIKCRGGLVVLPVTMLYFRGKNEEKDNVLSWATANEFNAKSFIVERSFTAVDFTAIGTVTARGNSGGVYEFTDRRVDQQPSKVFYYRLKQLDIDGKLVYSNVIKLNYKEGIANPSIVYPNPTKALITVSIGDPALIGTEAILIDVSGKRLQVVELTSLSQTFDLHQYVNGIYFIRLSNGETLRIVKQ